MYTAHVDYKWQLWQIIKRGFGTGCGQSKHGGEV